MKKATKQSRETARRKRRQQAAWETFVRAYAILTPEYNRRGNARLPPLPPAACFDALPMLVKQKIIERFGCAHQRHGYDDRTRKQLSALP